MAQSRRCCIWKGLGRSASILMRWNSSIQAGLRSLGLVWSRPNAFGEGRSFRFSALARYRMAGTLTLTGGCGGTGGAQPLAVTLNEGVCLIVDVDESRLQHRSSTATSTRWTPTSTAVESALRQGRAPGRHRWASSATAPRSPERCAAAWTSTSSPTRPAPTTRCPTCPRAWTSPTGTTTPSARPGVPPNGPARRWPGTVEAMVGFLDGGAEVFDYGDSIRDEARLVALDRAVRLPGFVPAYIRPLFCEGRARSGGRALWRPQGHPATDRAVMDLFPDNDRLQKWMRAAGERVAFQGLPARICWLGYGERDVAGCGWTRWWPPAKARRRSSSAVTTSTADGSPRRTARPSSILDGSDAIADWPLLNALVNTASALPRCPSTTAAAWASASRSTPVRSRSPTHRAGRGEAGPVLTNEPRHGGSCRPRRRRLRPRAGGRRRRGVPHSHARGMTGRSARRGRSRRPAGRPRPDGVAAVDRDRRPCSPAPARWCARRPSVATTRPGAGRSRTE